MVLTGDIVYSLPHKKTNGRKKVQFATLPPILDTDAEPTVKPIGCRRSVSSPQRLNSIVKENQLDGIIRQLVDDKRLSGNSQISTKRQLIDSLIETLKSKRRICHISPRKDHGSKLNSTAKSAPKTNNERQLRDASPPKLWRLMVDGKDNISPRLIIENLKKFESGEMSLVQSVVKIPQDAYRKSSTAATSRHGSYYNNNNNQPPDNSYPFCHSSALHYHLQQNQPPCAFPVGVGTSAHRFSTLESDRLLVCDVCNQLILGRALHCRECELVCHGKCERAIATHDATRSCCNGYKSGRSHSVGKKVQTVSERYGNGTHTYQSIGTSSSGRSTNQYQTFTTASGSRCNQINSNGFYLSNGVMTRDNAEIDVVFITERILVLTFPNAGSESAYKNSLKEVSQMLRTKHGTNYKIFNVSKRRSDLAKHNINVVDFGWPEELAPPLEKLCAICKEIENWLTADGRNVVVVHSKGGRSRPSIVISAYMHYTNVCASEDQALDRFAMRRFSDDSGSGSAQPSHRRYVRYFSSLLSGTTKINSNPIFLHHLTVTDLPQLGEKGGSRPVIKVYEKMEPVYSSGVFSVDADNNELNIRFSPALSLRGDVLIKCFHKNATVGGFPASLVGLSSGANRQTVFRCQFNTCALDFDDGFRTNQLVFDKMELDEIHQDRSANTELVLLFSLSAEPSDLPSQMATPVFEPLTRFDSYENFDHTNEDSDSSTNEDAHGSEFDNMSRKASVSSQMQKPLQQDVGGFGVSNSPQRQLVNGQLYATIQKQPNESADSGIGSDLSGVGGSKPHPPLPLFNGLHDGEVEEDDPIIPVASQYQHQQATLESASKKEQLRQQQNNLQTSASAAKRHPTSPPVPPKPKPRTNLVTDSPHRPHGILPTGVRPLSPPADGRPTSPADGQPQQQPLIDVELVGKDRYDPQSKAFSYVPKRDLEKHFQSPRKETQLVRRLEDSEGREVIIPKIPVNASATLPARMDSRQLQDVSDNEQLSPSKAQQPMGHTLQSHDFPSLFDQPTPTSIAGSSDVTDERMQMTETTPVSSKSKQKGKKNRAYSKYKTLDDYESDMDDLCDPDFYLSFDADSPTVAIAQPPATTGPASTTPLTRRQESLRPTIPPPPPSHDNPGSRTQFDRQTPSATVAAQWSYDGGDEDGYRRVPVPPPRNLPSPSSSSFVVASPPSSYRRQRVAAPPPAMASWGDALEEELMAAAAMPAPPPRSAPALVRPASSWSNALDNDVEPVPQPPQSRSVTTTPVSRHRQVVSDGGGSGTDANSRFQFSTDLDPDAWLENQLEKLKLRREMNDPDRRRRKEQEKLLLEELKNVHDDRMLARGRNEADYTVEGMGAKTVDPLEEFRREEQRNLQSPAGHSQPKVLGLRKARDAHGGAITPTLQHPYVGARKPPTPPPRERSRTPPSPRRMSPVTVSNRAGAGRNSGRQTPPQTKQQPNYQPHESPSHRYDSTDYARQTSAPSAGGGDFDHLEQLVWNDTSPTSNAGGRVRRTDSQMSDRSGQQSASYRVQPSPKSILKKPKSLTTNGSVDYVSDAEEYRRGQAPIYASANDATNRSETPSFPVAGSMGDGGRVTTPFHPLLYSDGDDDPRSPGQVRTPVAYQRPPQMHQHSLQYRSPSPGSMYYGQSRRSSVTSLEPMEVINHHPVFVKDTSKFWYKPKISREDAINLLKDKPPGTFIIRDSNSFPGAFGLALKVDKPPPGVQARSGDGTELVRHFLIEPSPKGVKLKGCNNEPVFGTLSALVYQHSITPLALPTKLVLPDYDPAAGPEPNQAMQLLHDGAACNVTYIHTCDTESLTGPEAVRRVVAQALSLHAERRVSPISVHFKASAQGVTITDNTRKLFFRRHYPVHAITFCGLDPDQRVWKNTATNEVREVIPNAQIFGFVARKVASSTDNACHIFAELEPKQPASAIVNFITRVVLPQAKDSSSLQQQQQMITSHR